MLFSICSNQEEAPLMEISQSKQNDCITLDTRSIKKKELQKLMEKCRELQREVFCLFYHFKLTL